MDSESQEKHDEQLLELEEFGPIGQAPLALPHGFTEKLQTFLSYEEKLAFTLSFMQESLEKGGGHHFKEFWDARKLCIEFFKEAVDATRRVQLWSTYSELCREARRRKEVFDDQSAFVTEQMELAIHAMEKDLASIQERVAVVADIPELEGAPLSEENKYQYLCLQKELTVFNAFAHRTTALRKELIHADIRLRSKNKLFGLLSAIGDTIFPRRKQLIQSISQLFLEDVERFIRSLSIDSLSTPQLFDAREKVKVLQQLAKILTLRTEVFNATRLQLSECWDRMKSVIKVKKKEQAEVRSQRRHCRDELLDQIKEMHDGLLAKTIGLSVLERGVQELYAHLRGLMLLPQDMKYIKNKLHELENDLASHRLLEKNQKKMHLQEIEKEKHSCLHAFFEKIESLIQSPQEVSKALLEDIEQQKKSLSLNRKEHYEVERLMARLQSALFAYERSNMLSSSDSERVHILKEKELLRQQKQAIKEHLDVLRKEQGSSNADFSYAMQLDDMIREEKQRLLEIEASLQAFHE